MPNYQAWFDNTKNVLETAYLTGQQPWQQSGFGLHNPRTFEDWQALRKPVADCIISSGSFLDIGCANGYLLECVMQWLTQRNLIITPFGLDISDQMIALATKRLPAYVANLFVGNSWDWIPPQTFDYVRTELVYVPDQLQPTYIARLLDHFVSPGGRLLLAEYRSVSRPEPDKAWLNDLLDSLDYQPEYTKSGYLNGIEGARIIVLKKP